MCVCKEFIGQIQITWMWETAKLLEHWETVKSLGHGKQTNHTKHNEHKDPCLGFMLIILYKKMGWLNLLVAGWQKLAR